MIGRRRPLDELVAIMMLRFLVLLLNLLQEVGNILLALVWRECSPKMRAKFSVGGSHGPHKAFIRPALG